MALIAAACQSTAGFGWWKMMSGIGPVAPGDYPISTSFHPSFSQEEIVMEIGRTCTSITQYNDSGGDSQSRRKDMVLQSQ